MKTNSTKFPISIVIVAKNEEKRLKRCLEACDFAHEIILVDDNSTDKTVEIAKSFNAKVFQRKMEGWGEQQTFAISKASQSWIFLLDCDEIISSELRTSIIKAVQENNNFSYEVRRSNRFENFNATHGTLRSDWVPRLIKNEGVRVEGSVHPKIILPYPLKKISGPLYHYTYSDVNRYYEKMNQYCRLSAEKYISQGRNPNFFVDIVLRPFWAVFKVYFLNRGFLDGRAGFIFAANHYSYTLQKYVRFYIEKKYKGRF